MAGKIEFRTLPPTPQSFGVAIDFVAGFAPFDTVPTGVFSRVLRRQILRGEHVTGWSGERLVAYAGWLPTTERAARLWLAGGGELLPADDAADAVALTTVAATDPHLVRGLMRAARDRNPGRRVFFKRDYADAARPARKSAVFNGTRPPPRPPIADDPCGLLYRVAAEEPGRTTRLLVGETPILVVQDPALAAHVLVGNGAGYAKNFASFSPLFGASRLTLDGEAWRRSQRVTQPFIAPHDVARAEAILVDRYAALPTALCEGGGGPADAAIDRASLGALVGLAFSAELHEFGDTFPADLRTVIRHCTARAWDLPGVPVGTTEADSAAAQEATARIRDAVRALVQRRRAVANPPGDALAALLAEFDASGHDGTPLDLVGEIVTLIVAGSDTTSAAIGWALAILAEHEDFQQQLRTELADAIGGRTPALADIDRVPSLKPFIDETLRMFPPVAILSRLAVADDEIDGHRIAAGDRVLVSVIGIHQNPAAWEAPREFHLDRHQPGAIPRPGRRSVFMPFSEGPRICGGARLARMELALALMLVLQRCRLDLPEPLPLAFEWGASMRRRGGQRIRARRL